MVERSILIEPSPIDDHWDWNIIHAFKGIRGIESVVIPTSRVELISLIIVTAIIVIIARVAGAVTQLKPSLLVIEVLEVSRRSSLESRSRDKRRSIGLSYLITLGALAEDVL